MAASGLPNICLTLTIVRDSTRTKVEQYSRLHIGWKNLTKRIIRQFRKPPEKRWELKTDEGYPYYDIETYRITSNTRAKQKPRLHYMAFVEETENGEPHLHILLRSKYLPQRWLSQQMQELINSPIVWVEKVKGATSAIQYVTKYVTEAPAQFGKSRRYWYSRFYKMVTKVKRDRPLLDRKSSVRIRQSFRDLILEILNKGLVPVPLEREEIRLYKFKNAWDYFRDEDEWSGCAEIISAQTWLGTWRRQCGL